MSARFEYFIVNSFEDTSDALGDERHDEADEAQRLGERGCQDEDREGSTLDLGLTSHGARGAECSKADGEAGTDNTETISDNSHNSSFAVRLGREVSYVDGRSAHMTSCDARFARKLVAVSLGDLDIHSREHREDVGLDKRDDELDRVDDQQDGEPGDARDGARDRGRSGLLEQGFGKQRGHDGE